MNDTSEIQAEKCLRACVWLNMNISDEQHVFTILKLNNISWRRVCNYCSLWYRLSCGLDKSLLPSINWE